MTHIITTDNTDYHERALWLDENTCVSQVYINDLVMRIGSIGVRMAGIGGVETNREYRKKGYMRTLIEDSVTYMMDQGYCVSALYASHCAFIQPM
jgi:predicted acetyltransferase